MKIEIPISWDWHKQEEGEVIVDIPESKCKEIVRHFLMKKDYHLRREWLVENVPEINLNVLFGYRCVGYFYYWVQYNQMGMVPRKRQSYPFVYPRCRRTF